MKSCILSLVVVVVSSSLAAVAQERSLERPVVHHYFSKTPHPHAAAWSYSGATGPERWGRLDPSYRLADEGRQQSPIDIDTRKAVVAELPELKFDYRPERIAAVNNGHTIQHDETPGSYLHVGAERFSLEQFHVHSPSEHTIDGRRFDMEIHFVHKSPAGQVVVVGVLVQADEKARLDLPLYDDLPTRPGEKVDGQATRNASDFLPRRRDYFAYAGSFTTPACDEQVRWIVLKQPIGCPPKIVERFATILRSNARPVQKLNDRVVHQK